GPGILSMGVGAAAIGKIVRDSGEGQGTRHPRSVFENSKSRLRFWRDVFRRIGLVFRAAATAPVLLDYDSHAMAAHPQRAPSARSEIRRRISRVSQAHLVLVLTSHANGNRQTRDSEAARRLGGDRFGESHAG